MDASPTPSTGGGAAVDSCGAMAFAERGASGSRSKLCGADECKVRCSAESNGRLTLLARNANFKY